MQLKRLPITLCHGICPKCGLPTEFKMFESGPGGDFETYVGIRSGTIYRLDLGMIHYLHRSKTDLLSEAMGKEGKMICIPKEIRCKICGTIFAPTRIGIDGEEFIDAYELE